MVESLASKVILEVPKSLMELMKSLSKRVQVFELGETLPKFDYQCPMMSLPLAFKTQLHTIPSSIPYLSCSQKKLNYWQIKLSEHKKLRVGLVWSGGFRPNQPELWAENARRNMPLEKFAIFKDLDVIFYSLQKGEPAESDLKIFQKQGWGGPNILDYVEELYDFSDTAAFVQNLDLVIAVDTSTAHLAGALGKPVWLLNRYDSCWRWLLEKDDSPWYPSLKIYRQIEIDNWDTVLKKMREDLEKLLINK
jgi:hypothetical protein